MMRVGMVSWIFMLDIDFELYQRCMDRYPHGVMAILSLEFRTFMRFPS